MAQIFKNPEVDQVAAAFDVAVSSSSDAPAWLLHLDRLKSLEHEEKRGKVAHHETSMASYAKDLALSVGITEKHAEQIRVTLLWHDIGKLKTPLAILDKKGPLTNDERVVMNKHADDGRQQLAAEAGVPDLFMDIAMHHHERYDGKGYHGIKGEEISYAARIAHVTDVFDAITEYRAYRDNQLTNIDALMLMVNDNKGGNCKHDPFLLRQFTKLIVETQLADDPDPRIVGLRAFIESDPMDDVKASLSKDQPILVSIRPDGQRTLLKEDATGKRVVDCVVGPNGVSSKEAKRLGSEPVVPSMSTMRP